jgi:hypothetical protein
MARLCWVFVDRAAARDALARRQVCVIFNSTDQHIESSVKNLKAIEWAG